MPRSGIGQEKNMAVKLKVRYLDGRMEEVVASPRAQVMTEQFIGGFVDERRVQAGYYLAWASLHKAGKEPADYETWLDRIADVDEVEDEVEEVRPTQPDQPADSSSD
jgi:hypothetical protein